MFQLNNDAKRREILAADGNLLIMGGPGSGKTTIALFKAQQIVESHVLKPYQKVLFLSFARATISRIEEQAKGCISEEVNKRIEINTYHGFIWDVIRHHGYLINKNPIRIWPPHEANCHLSSIPEEKQAEEKMLQFSENGLLHFDLFADVCNQLLTSSNAVQNIISSMYPVIILDEFQDTNSDEWQLISTLGAHTTLIALADPEQRIYDFRGADPKRIHQFIDRFTPKLFDFGKENNRSNGTDIVKFGNDLLSGKNKGGEYRNVEVYGYNILKPPHAHYWLKTAILMEIKKLKERHPTDEWSLAILVPTNKLMRDVSDYLNAEQIFLKGKKLPSIVHDVAIETEGPALAAIFLATLLDDSSTESNVIQALSNHIAGRKKKLSIENGKLVSAINAYLSTGKINGRKREACINDCKDLYSKSRGLIRSGNVIEDWKQVVRLIASSTTDPFKNVSSDLLNLRLLRRGSQLQEQLDITWRTSHSYTGAVEAVSSALIFEHFSMSTRKWNGVNVMTIHRSKGKEFDEVIVYEQTYQNRIVRDNSNMDQARLNLRVAVTRAREKALILTPDWEPCPLL